MNIFVSGIERGQVCDVQGRVLFANAFHPSGFFVRLRGLIGRKALRESEAWWFSRCSAVHTCGMRFPIDVLHLSSAGVVLRVCAELAPNRISAMRCGSSVLELAAGSAHRLGLRAGLQLRFCL